MHAQKNEFVRDLKKNEKKKWNNVDDEDTIESV